MKVFLVILMMFVTLGSSPAHAGNGQAAGLDKSQGIFHAIADFLSSMFGDGLDELNSPGGNGKGSGQGKGVAQGGNPVGKGDAWGRGGDPNGALIQYNDSSFQFLATQIAADTGWPQEKMLPYSRRLARTLSQLSAEEQIEVFFGSDS